MAISKRRSKNSLVCRLPVEILSDILVRLSLKDLTILKTLCKSLQALITSNDFAKLHFRHSIQSPCLQDRALILQSSNNPLHVVSLDGRSGSVSQAFKLNLKGLNVERIVGCCNGLLLCTLQQRHGSKKVRLALVNPSTLWYKRLETLQLSEDCIVNSYGFGHDHVTDDYKVVLIVYRNVSNKEKKSGTETLIYRSRGGGDSWNMFMNDDTPAMGGCNSCIGVLMNNHLLHWYSSADLEVFSFDICTEKWSQVPLPSCASRARGTFDLYDIQVQNGCLCLTATVWCEPPQATDGYEYVWVMKEYGVQDSWVKLFNITEHQRATGIRYWGLAISDSSYAQGGDDIEIWSRRIEGTTSTVKWYSSRKRETRRVDIRGDPGFSSTSTPCTRTLVTLE